MMKNSQIFSDYNKTTLENGLRILTSTIKHTNAVSINFFLGAGSRYESDSLAGASHLFEHVLFKGTKNKPTSREISIVVEGVGGIINAFTDREMTGYWCHMPYPNYRSGIDLISDMIRNSLFREKDIENEKHVIYEEIRSASDSPSGKAGLTLDSVLWPNQAMGRGIAGTTKSVENISKNEMLQYLNTQYVASNLIISVAGNITHENIVDQITQTMSDFRDGEIQQMIPFEDNLSGPVVSFEKRDTEQTTICLGMHALPYNHPKRDALSLLSIILGETMSSRLFEEVREKRALAYDIHSSCHFFSDCGVFQVECGIDPSKLYDALPVIISEISRLRDGVTDEECSGAKKLAIGRLLLRMEDSRSIANFIGVQELLKNKVDSLMTVIDRLETVTTDNITSVANDVIKSQKLAVSIVGPQCNESKVLSFLDFT